MAELTCLQANNESLRSYLRLHRMFPDQWSEANQQRLEMLLATRKRYRSDAQVKVWIIEDGCDWGDLIFDDESDFQAYLQDCDPDFPLTWRESIMSGRAVGQLPVWE